MDTVHNYFIVHVFKIFYVLCFRDLRFKKGDVILLRKQVDENWYHGELDGKSGFFPATYVQVSFSLTLVYSVF